MKGKKQIMEMQVIRTNIIAEPLECGFQSIPEPRQEPLYDVHVTCTDGTSMTFTGCRLVSASKPQIQGIS